jgi:hypothetical protein
MIIDHLAAPKYKGGTAAPSENASADFVAVSSPSFQAQVYTQSSCVALESSLRNGLQTEREREERKKENGTKENEGERKKEDREIERETGIREERKMLRQRERKKDR